MMMTTTSPQTTDPRPMRDYPCPHCGGMGEVVEDHIDYRPIMRPCGSCEGRGHFTRPVLPRGAVRAFEVLDTSYGGWWDNADSIVIVHATSAAKAKATVAHATQRLLGRTAKETFLALHVRRAPEHDEVQP